MVVLAAQGAHAAISTEARDMSNRAARKSLSFEGRDPPDLSVRRRQGRTAPSTSPSPAAVAEIVSYIAQLSREMAQLATSIEQHSLAYFLSMAQAEADLEARKRQLDR